MPVTGVRTRALVKMVGVRRRTKLHLYFLR